MDYSDTFAVHTIGLYAVRFGYLAAWPLAELGQRMGGQPIGMADLRAQFAQVLQTELPPALPETPRPVVRPILQLSPPARHLALRASSAVPGLVSKIDAA